jgi:hypothetical protein
VHQNAGCGGIHRKTGGKYMKTKTVQTQTEKTVYVADDGTEFDSKGKCEEHEQNIAYCKVQEMDSKAVTTLWEDCFVVNAKDKEGVKALCVRYYKEPEALSALLEKIPSYPVKLFVNEEYNDWDCETTASILILDEVLRELNGMAKDWDGEKTEGNE